MTTMKSALERDKKENDETVAQISVHAIKIHDDLDKIIRGTILPNRHTQNTFTSQEAKLYVNNRKWLVPSVPEPPNSKKIVYARNKKLTSKKPSNSISKTLTNKKGQITNYYKGKPFYESYMDFIFWDTNKDKNLLFIEGEVGIGKSTFIDYYFRCFCPHNSKNQKKIYEKCFFKVDLKNIHNEKKLYREIQESFINSLKNYIGNDKNNIFDEIENEIYSIDAENIGLWWKKIYQFYEKLILNKVLHKSPYLVIILDNIDQCSRELQTTLVREAEELIKKANKIWLIVIPVWPSTLTYLKDDDHMRFRTSRYYHLKLGRVQRVKCNFSLVILN